MDLSIEYKGFLIEPLVYPFPLASNQKGHGQPNLQYQVAVRITDLRSSSSSVSKPPLLQSFSCLGDARRAAEIFGRGMVDTPLGSESDARSPPPSSGQECQT